MTKGELKQAIKLVDSISKLLETGFFPGRKAPQVLDAMRYISVLKHSLKTAPSNLEEKLDETKDEVKESAPEIPSEVSE